MKKISTLVLSFVLSSCAQSQRCDLVQDVAKDSAKIRKIEAWVDHKESEGYFSKRNAIPSRLVRPGDYSVAVPQALRWSPSVEARVLTEPDGTPKAVFLGEYDLQGLVVNFDLDGGNSLLPPDILKPVNLRTSVICVQRD